MPFLGFFIAAAQVSSAEIGVTEPYESQNSLDEKLGSQLAQSTGLLGQTGRTLLQTGRTDTSSARTTRCYVFTAVGQKNAVGFYSKLNQQFQTFLRFYPGSRMVTLKVTEKKVYTAAKVLKITTDLQVSIVASNTKAGLAKFLQLWNFNPKTSFVVSSTQKVGLLCRLYGNMPGPDQLCATYLLKLAASTTWNSLLRYARCTVDAVQLQIDPPRQVVWELTQLTASTAYLQLTYGSAGNDTFISPCDSCVPLSPRTWLSSYFNQSALLKTVSKGACIPMSDHLRGAPAIQIFEYTSAERTGPAKPTNGSVCIT